jgi:DNA-binding SARP family transcriptional activator
VSTLVYASAWVDGALRFNVLGPVQVLDRARRVDIGGPKQRAVLAALVIDVGTVVSLDRLIDRLWGDQPPARATGTLQAYISNLRRALEPDRSPRAPASVLATQPPGYVLRVAATCVDAVRFEHLVAEGSRLADASRAAAAATVLDEALDLWRGPPLDDLAFEASFRSEIARLEELHAVAVEVRLGADLALGRHHTAVAQLEAMVARQPLRERLWELLVLALYRAGRQADALRALRAARQTLREEIGVDPGPALRRLEQDVLDQHRSLEWTPPVAVPVAGRTARPDTDTDTDTVPVPTVEPFVGRGATLASLVAALERARVGAGPRLVLVSGEPGIGKTRCVEELARRAAADGIGVAWGRCSDSAGVPAFWPWMQLFRTIVDGFSARQVDDALGPVRAELATVLPYIGVSTPAVAAGAPEPDGAPASRPAFGPGASADVRRFQLHDSATAFLARLLGDRTQLLVVDDLHWADSASLRALEFLATDRRLAHVLVVATYRDVEVTPGSALDALLTVVAGETSVQHLALERFDRETVHEFITTSTGQAVDDDVIDAVHERTSGNAFFVAELVRLLCSEARLGDAEAVRSDARIPAEVRAVVRRRLARLPEEVSELLSVAAVVGDEFDIDVLERAVELRADRVLDLIDLAVVTGIIVEASSTCRYRFAHSLVRDALYQDLTSVQRARFHARVGHAVHELWGADVQPHVSELAHHFSLGAAAGTAELAVEFASLAAESATAQFAFDQAAEHWHQALSALDRARPGDRDARYEILMAASDAHRCAGDIEASRRVLHDAIAIVTRMGDAERMARAAVSFSGGAGWAWSWREYGTVDTQAVELLERALDRLGPADTVLRCDVLGALGVELYHGDERGRSIELSRQALAMAERLGGAELEATMLNLHYVASQGADRPEGRLAIARRMIDLRGAPREVAMVGHMYRSNVHLEFGDLAAADADLDAAARIAERLRQPAMLAQVAWCRAMRSLLLGQFDDAEAASIEAYDLHRRTTLWGAIECFCTQLFTLRRDQGRIIELQPMLADLAASSQFVGFREAAALMYLDLGLPEDARDVLGARASFPPMPRDWSWLFLTCLQAEVCAGLGDRAAAERLAADLEPFGDLMAVIGTGVCCWGPVAYFLGLLAIALDRRTDAEARLAQAVEMATRIGAHPWRARAAHHLAAIASPSGRPAGAS